MPQAAAGVKAGGTAPWEIADGMGRGSAVATTGRVRPVRRDTGGHEPWLSALRFGMVE
jgi:hypothetical protein